MTSAVRKRRISKTQTYGVEIETYLGENINFLEPHSNGAHRKFERLRESLRLSEWKLDSDGSLSNDYNNGAEFKTPIFKFSNIRSNEKEIRTLCEFLKRHDSFTDNSCGLHVHIGNNLLSPEDVVSVFRRYAKFEHIIDSFMGHHRAKSNNEYCESVSEVMRRYEEDADVYLSEGDYDYDFDPPKEIKRKKNFTEVLFEIIKDNSEKYCKVYYSDLKTLEFRHHHGTLSSDDINNWVKFLKGFVLASTKKLKKGEEDSLWRCVDKKVVKYFKQKLEAREELKRINRNR